MKRIKFISLIAILSSFVCSFSSCSNDDDNELKYKNLTIVAGSTATIENGKDISWTSENEYIASVESNIVQAKRVGTTKIVSDKGSFTVTVTPKYNLYEEPCMQWGCSKSVVKSFMKNYEELDETEDVILYEGRGMEDYIGYTFENSKLKTSSVYIPVAYMDELVDFISERYIYATKTDDYVGFISVDMKTLAVVTATYLGSNYYYAVICGAAPDDLKQTSRSSDVSETIFEELLKGSLVQNVNQEKFKQLKNIY